MENFGKTSVFSGRIWPDWGNTTRADMAGLGSIGLRLTTTIKIVRHTIHVYNTMSRALST